MKRKCVRDECSKEFEVKIPSDKKMYCSRSCSAVVNNSKFPKRNKEGNCRTCNIEILSSRKYCLECRNKYLEERELYYKSMTEKSCVKCREVKPIEEFPVQSKSPSGYGKYCTDCNRENVSKWAESNPERYSDRIKRRTDKNGVRFSDSWFKIKSRVYNIPIQKLKDMFVSSEGLCEICFEYTGANLVIDHDHDTGEVRGLLCQQCNIGLGAFKDSQTSLIQAIQYLNSSD